MTIVPKLDTKSILNQGLGIAAGLTILGAAGYALYTVAQQTGFSWSYAGLSKREVKRVLNKLYRDHTVLSTVKGREGGKRYYRGIIYDQGGFPLYYRANFGRGNNADLSIYPMLWNQNWNTNPNLFHPSERLIKPSRREGGYGSSSSGPLSSAVNYLDYYKY